MIDDTKVIEYVTEQLTKIPAAEGLKVAAYSYQTDYKPAGDLVDFTMGEYLHTVFLDSLGESAQIEEEGGIISPRRLFTIKKKDGSVVGLFGIIMDEHNKIWLSWFGVHIYIQRSGIGAIMLHACEQMAYDAALVDDYTLWVETYLPLLPKAVKFYRKHGFVKAGTIYDFICCDGEYHDKIVMRKNLASKCCNR